MTWSWGERLKGEATNRYLARVLHNVGLYDLERNAIAYHYDDYFCPPDVDDGMNIHRLIFDLLQKTHDPLASAAKKVAVKEIINAAKDGQFDGTKEESEKWAQSPSGQAVMRDLLKGR